MRVVTMTLIAALAAAPLFAADAPDAGRLLRESTPQPVLPKGEKPVIVTPEKPGESKGGEGVTIKVGAFSISGNTVFTASELQGLIVGYAGKELSLTGLERVARVITDYYRGQGYFLAEAYVPPQTLRSGGEVRIVVLEGRLERLQIKTVPDQQRTSRSVLERYTAKLPIGAPVREDQLTEMAMLLNELPSLRSRIVMMPGEQSGGTQARLEVTEDKPFRVTLDSDNHGNYATGYYRSGIGLELFSPLTLGDRMNLRVQSSTSGDMQTVNFGWSVPVSGTGTRLGVDYGYLRYALGRSFTFLDAEGDAHQASLYLKQPLVRRGNLLVDALVSGNVKLLDDRIGLGSSRSKRHLAGGQIGLTVLSADELGGANSLMLLYSGGVAGFDNAAALADDQGSNGLRTDGQYHKVSGMVSRSQRLFGDLSLYAALRGQWSDNNLMSAEQMYLGGPYAVRAYPVGEASADIGVITTLELRYLLRSLGVVPGQLQLSGLFDHGYARSNETPLAGIGGNHRTLYGAGFGLAYNYNESVSLTTSVAWRLGEAPTSDADNKPTVFFQGVVRF